VFVCHICLIITNANADETTIERFRSEYPVEARYLSDRFDRCSGTIHYESSENHEIKRLDVDFYRSHGFDKIEVNIETSLGNKNVKGMGVYCVDASSAFELSRSLDQRQFIMGKRRMSPLEREVFEIDYARIPRAPLGGYQKSLIDMLDSGVLKLVDASVSVKDPGIVDATFAVEDNSPLKQIIASFDTRNHWAIVRQSMHVGSQLRLATDYVVEYGDRIVEGIRLPVRFIDKKNDQRRLFAKCEFGELPRESFTPAHYGLPDLKVTRKRSIGRFEIILGIIALLIVIMGVAFQRLSNRNVPAESLELRQ
jgi:hypothetical protein